MSTIAFSCGCSFSYSMWEPYPLMEFHICLKHMADPRVQDCKVSDLRTLIETLQEVPSETLG